MKRISRRTLSTTVLMVMIMGIPVMLTAATSVIDELNVFSPNTVISSSKVNENFVMLDERIATYEDAIAVDGNNNVGIGTTDPGTYKLRTRNDSANYVAMFENQSANSGAGIADLYLTNGALTSGTNLLVRTGAVTSGVVIADFQSNATSRLYVRADGNVGIGTASPLYMLDIYQAKGGSSNYIRVGAASYEYGLMGVDETGVRLQSDSPTKPLYFMTSAAERMRIDASGNVGIGTTAPAAKLEVLGTSDGTDNGAGLRVQNIKFNSFQGAFITSVAANPSIFGSQREPNDGSGTFPFNQYGELVFQASTRVGYNNGFSWATGSADINSTASPTVKMRLTEAGSVGIGTTSPTEKLHVVGNILATGTVTETSDSRLKRDITPLENAADGIACLQGVTYRWDDPTSPQELQLGLIAQDVERCYPEVVNTDYKGFKSVSYARLVAPLIEAVKEQQTTISAQQLETRALRSALEATNARLARLEASLSQKR